jgi:hypothetical protein
VTAVKNSTALRHARMTAKNIFFIMQFHLR